MSIVIPGQQTALDPQPIGNRVRAFTHEAPAGGSDSYTWAGLKPGTYLYHSGSDLATQVHMGLYGALVVGVAPGQAYPGVLYDVDVVLLTSEVDPALHNPPAMATPLTYHPKYFLANGRADGSTTLGSGGTGPFVNDTVLFRFVNAGLLNYVPTLLGEDMVFIAEDGNPYNYAAPSYGELLAAGKTLDALWVPVSEGTHALFDRRLHMSSNGVPGGGLVASVVVTYADVPTANAGPDQLRRQVLDSAEIGHRVSFAGDGAAWQRSARQP